MPSRRHVLHLGSLSAALAGLLPVTRALAQNAAAGSQKMPVLFIGHGSPMNAISTNVFTQMLALWGRSLPQPTAILVVSAHWLTRGSTGVTVNAQPHTIHHFSRFPKALPEMP